MIRIAVRWRDDRGEVFEISDRSIELVSVRWGRRSETLVRRGRGNVWRSVESR